MNTLAHIVIACAALSRRQAPNRNRAVIIGALVPDASMFVFFAWSRIQGWSGDETWNVQYWNEPWQMIGAASNSFVVFSVILLMAAWRKWPLFAIASLAALIHVALDFPLHADDAHRHFWPLSDWRFASPVSYWDPDHHGRLGSALETLGVVGAVAVLWRRFPRWSWRGLFGALLALQCLAFTVQLIF